MNRLPYRVSVICRTSISVKISLIAKVNLFYLFEQCKNGDVASEGGWSRDGIGEWQEKRADAVCGSRRSHKRAEIR